MECILFAATGCAVYMLWAGDGDGINLISAQAQGAQREDTYDNADNRSSQKQKY